jgi:hypothetical protein
MCKGGLERGREALAKTRGAELISRWQNGVPIAPVDPRLSQVVLSTPLGVPCSELPAARRASAPFAFAHVAASSLLPAKRKATTTMHRHPPGGSQLGGSPLPGTSAAIYCSREGLVLVLSQYGHLALGPKPETRNQPGGSLIEPEPRARAARAEAEAVRQSPFELNTKQTRLPALGSGAGAGAGAPSARVLPVLPVRAHLTPAGCLLQLEHWNQYTVHGLGEGEGTRGAKFPCVLRATPNKRCGFFSIQATLSLDSLRSRL